MFIFHVFFIQISSKGNSVSCSNTPQIRLRNGKGIALQSNNRLGRGGQHKPETHKSNNLLPSPTRSEEHQYDIPFSHLSPLNVAVPSRKSHDEDIDPEYDEMIVNDSTNHVNRGSTAVLLPHSSSKKNKVAWNKFSGDSSRLRRENISHVVDVNSTGMLWGGSTLLQPRLISGETGATPLLAKHSNLEGIQRWSGSDRSIDTSVYSGILVHIHVTNVSLD